VTVDYHSAVEEAVFRMVNVDGGRALDLAFYVLSAKWFGLLAGTAVVAYLALRGGRRRWALLLAFALALCLSDLVGARVLRPLLHRMRPCYALPPGSFRKLWAASDVGSLPSLHASNFFAMAGVAWAANRRAGQAVGAVAALVAVSRVYLGVHWPTDVLAGVAWGLGCAAASLQVARRALAALPRRPGSPSRSAALPGVEGRAPGAGRAP
jgi:undecaprenyl-diphosphatase